MQRSKWTILRPSARALARRNRSVRFESLETRTLLAGEPLVISELMAINDSTHADEDGAFSDWFEVHNPTTEAVDLALWTATDDADDLTKWTFPSVSLAAGEYLVVFASGNDRTDPASELHTNFRLSGGGEYLSLARPDRSIAHEYAPDFPQQQEDISYGIAEGVIDGTKIVDVGASVDILIPDSPMAGIDWTQIGFDANSNEWISGTTAIGFGGNTPNGFGALTPGFTVRNVSSSGSIESLADAEAVLAGSDILSETTVVGVPVIDYLDRSSGGHFGGNSPFPDANATSSDFVLQSTAFLIIEQAGSYTFGMHTDNGGKLLIDGEIVINDDVNRPAHDKLSKGITLTAGTHTLEHVMFQDGEFSETELFAAPGSHRGFNDQFELVGDTAGGGLEVLTIGDGPGITDIGDQMLGENASALVRTEFTLDEDAQFQTLGLSIQYDDGFVAYLNGTEIARRNAPVDVTWDSSAAASRELAETLVFEDVDVSEHAGLLQVGDNVLAIHGLNVSVDDADFLITPILIAGRESAQPRYFATPTPGAANSNDYFDTVADTEFSIDRGFYETPQQVEITSDTEDATIFYSTDGSDPSVRGKGRIYSGPITIGTTTTLRAVATKPGSQSSNIDTQTYIFLEDVIRQTGAGFPDTWGHSGADYEFDPDIVNSPLYGDTIIDDMRSVPTISLVMPMEDLFGADNGIYSHPSNSSDAFQRTTSVELINPDGSKGFQSDATVRIQGGSSVNGWKSDKLSMRLTFSKDSGPTKLNFPLFGDDAVDEFDTFLLDATLNLSWTHPSASQNIPAQFVRDQFMADAQNELGGYAPHAFFSHLYLNGLYWGMYYIHERPDDSFAESYLGGDKDDYDILKHTSGDVVKGTAANYQAMLSAVRRNQADSANYQAATEMLDIDGFIDYMIVNYYAANTDWSHHNWYASFDTDDPNALWRFHSWDAEHVLKGVSDNLTNDVDSGTPTEIHHSLMDNADYKMLFADRVQQHFFHDGLFTPENAAALYQTRLDEIDRAVVGESARWGDNRRPNDPYTRNAEWVAERDRLLNDYFPRRTDVAFNQFRNVGWVPTIDAPEFAVNGTAQHGGLVEGTGVSITGSGGRGVDTYYTLDGSDPRLPGGGINPDAIEYDGEPITLAEAALLRTRVLQNREWSAITTALFRTDPLPRYDEFVFTEIHYNPADPTPAELAVGITDADQFEFLEMTNRTEREINLLGLQLGYGVQFDFLDSNISSLAPGEILVLVNDTDAFEVRYGTSLPIAGEYSGNLSNGGEVVTVRAFGFATLYRQPYWDGRSWPGRADGSGSSLELINSEWRSSAAYGGTPGIEGTEPTDDIVVNEVTAKTLNPAVDSIELYNTTNSPVDVSGWWLSDTNDNYQKYQFPAGTIIAGGGYLVLDEIDFNASGGIVDNDFALNGTHGDDVWLLESDDTGKLTRFADHVEFIAMSEGQSYGRWPNGEGRLVPMQSVTFGEANGDPDFGPLVISEFMYDPPGFNTDELEYIEIYNPTSSSVDLTNWRIDGGVEYDFDAGTSLASGATLVISRFNPAALSNVDKLASFTDAYGADVAATIVGGYSGGLSASGERIRLLRPDSSPADEPNFVPGLLVDEIRYSRTLPWPTDAGGQGASLTRIATDVYGDIVTNWIAADPTPGTVNFDPPGETPSVVGLSVSSSQWSPEFLAAAGGRIEIDDNGPLSWEGIDAIHIQLDGDPSVPLTQEDLTLYGVTINDFTSRIDGFSYDPASHLATWTLNIPLESDRLNVALPVTVQSPGGGEYADNFDVLIGDGNRDGDVNLRDIQTLRDAVFANIGEEAYDATVDFDASGSIDIRDLQVLREHLLDTLPERQ